MKSLPELNKLHDYFNYSENRVVVGDEMKRMNKEEGGAKWKMLEKERKEQEEGENREK